MHSASIAGGEVRGQTLRRGRVEQSAHDIGVDLWEHGAEVTMVQRSPTIVVRADTMAELAATLYYAEAVSADITTDWPT